MSELSHRFDFRTLGALDLRDSAGARLSIILAHPKRTALLAYLAVATPRGFHRRDTLVGLFWPELDQERARASLRKAVHHLRQAMGSDIIVGIGDEEIALAHDRVDCDTVAFEALLTHDVPAALEQYGGPFLRGFFVPEAAEFERWMEIERARLRDVAFEGAWRLAEEEAHARNPFAAAHWARRAAALVPDDEGALRRLVSLLHTLGDRAGAVSAYEEFARRLKQDFDVEPSTETRALIRDVRRNCAGPAPATISSPTTTAPSQAAPPDAATPNVGTSVAAARVGTSVRDSRPTVRNAAFGVLALMLLLAAGRQMQRPTPPLAAAAVSRTSVAVFPFSFRGSASYGYLGDGLASLLATSLDGAGELNGIDPASFLAAVPPGNRTGLDPGDASALASRVGAGVYVVGEIVEVGGRLRVSAALHSVNPATAAAPSVVRASAEDTATQLFALVDRIAAQLVTVQTREPGARLTRIAAVTTRSLPALKGYLEGERFFRSGHYKEAVAAFQQAVDADSTFALAHYRLASAYGWSSDTMARPAANAAVRHSQHLSPPDRLLVEAFLPYINGSPNDAERRYREILSTRPFEGEAWHPLGEVLFHYNPVRGRSIVEAKPIFERALGMGPKDSPLTHLLEITAIERKYVEFDSLLNGIEPGAHFDLVGRLISAFTVGSAADRTRVLGEVRATSDLDLANTARHTLFLLEDRASADRIVRLLIEPPRPREVQALGHILSAHLEMSAGRVKTADAALAAAEQLDPDRALEHRGLLHAMLVLAGQTASNDAAYRAIERWNPAASGTPSVVFMGDEHFHAHFSSYLLGLLAASVGRYDDAQGFALDIERLPATRDMRAMASALAHGVKARIAWGHGRPDRALDNLRQIETERTPASVISVIPFSGLPQERFLRGEVLNALGRFDEAHSWFSAFHEHSAWGRVHIAPAHFRSGEIDERLGRLDEAALHYASFAELWKDADPELRPLVAEARARVDRLRAETRRR